MEWNDYLKETNSSIFNAEEKAPDLSQELSNNGGKLFNSNFSSLEVKFQG